MEVITGAINVHLLIGFPNVFIYGLELEQNFLLNYLKDRNQLQRLD